MPNITMVKPWDTPKEYKQLIKLLGWASGSMTEVENTSPEMEKAYKDLAAMCAFYVNEYKHRLENK